MGNTTCCSDRRSKGGNPPAEDQHPLVPSEDPVKAASVDSLPTKQAPPDLWGSWEGLGLSLATLGGSLGIVFSGVQNVPSFTLLALSHVHFVSSVVRFHRGDVIVFSTATKSTVEKLSSSSSSLSLFEIWFSDGTLGVLTGYTFVASTTILVETILYPTTVVPTAAYLTVSRVFAGYTVATTVGNLGRVIYEDPTRKSAKGLAQMGILLGGAVAADAMYDGTTFSYHPILMFAGLAAMYCGITVQRSGRQNWFHTGTTLASAAAIASGVGVILYDNQVQGYSLAPESVHSILGFTSLGCLIAQAAVAVVWMWPSRKPDERPQPVVVLHRWLGRVNVILFATTAVTGWEHVVGSWVDPSTIIVSISFAALSVLLTTPLWHELRIGKISW